MNFKGAAKRIEDLDLPRVGKLIGVGEDEVHAILDVEARGSGFDSQGRPKMLFEPHIFYRQLRGTKLTRAIREGLAYQAWKPGAYPADSYPRILKAMAIDEEAALCSASWGIGQVLGTNHKDVGYPTARAMVEAFMEDEENQLKAVIQFIIVNGLADDVRRHDWAGLAKGYNGSSYAKNGYHTKLSAAFNKWQKIRDTKFTPDQVAAPKPAPARTIIPPPKPALPVPAPAPKPAPAGFFMRLAALFGKVAS